MREFIVEADGGSRGNPGPAGYGAVVLDAVTGQALLEAAEYIGIATNNVAEYRGLLAGLRAARDLDPGAAVHVRMDSKLVVEQMSGRWKIKHPDLKPLAAEAARVLPPDRVTYEWIPRERNKHADRLANEAMDAGRHGKQWSPTNSTASLDTGGTGNAAGPQDAFGPKDAGGPSDAAGPQDVVRPQDAAGRRAGVSDAAGPHDAGGPQAAFGSQDAGGPSDAAGPRDAAGARGASRPGAGVSDAAGPQDAAGPGGVAGPKGAVRPKGAAGPGGAAGRLDAVGPRDSQVGPSGSSAPSAPSASRGGVGAVLEPSATGARGTGGGGKAGADVRAARAVATPSAGWAPADLGAPATLVLLRHGETPLTPQKRFSGSGGSDPSLSDVGREQARRVAAALARRGTVQAIVSSPLARTRETAAIVADRLGLDVAVADGLRETDFGAWEGLTFGEVRERHPDDLNAWLADPEARPTGGGESFAATAARIAVTRDELVTAYARRTVLLVTHVTPIKTFVRLALGAPPESLFRMELSAASLSAVAYYTDGNASVRLFNDTSHLR
ncbi:bifunctional RNase H/acid phosphatase [Streptomyces sp. NPDC102462]|uniref:bifunctional RNase H/acid phosphatase n=1 Tax=Streptomyces sp. NPDC102462 TaxID=3366178 RepID=UPI003819AFE6